MTGRGAPLIAAARQHLAGQDYLNGVTPPDTHDLDALETAYQAATAQNESDWPDNPSQRATNQHFIDIAFGTRKRDALIARIELTRAVTDWLAQPTPDGGPQNRRPPLTLWTKLTDERQAVDDRLANNAVDAPAAATGDPTIVLANAGFDPEPAPAPAPTSEPDVEAGRALTDWLLQRIAGNAEAAGSSPPVALPPAEQATLDALLKARADGAADTATVPAVREAIEHGLTSDDPRERLKWAREPLYRYKSQLSDQDFLRLAELQRQISPYDGMPREGLGHPIGTLDDNARLAIALIPGGTAGRAARRLLQRPAPIAGKPTLPGNKPPSPPNATTEPATPPTPADQEPPFNAPINAPKHESFLPKPKGIPEHWIATPSKKHGGMRYVDPTNRNNMVRVSPGDPQSPYPTSRRPYVIDQRDGKFLDKNGLRVPKKSDEAHIPYEEFVFRR